MVALMLAALALSQRGWLRSGYLCLGLSVGIKFVTAAIVPWFIWKQVAQYPWRKRSGAAVLAVLLVLLPGLVGLAAFGADAGAYDGIRVVFEHQTAGIQTRGQALLGGMLTRVGLLLLFYALLSVAVLRAGIPGSFLVCWAYFCVIVIFFGAPVAFAWYMVWPLAASLVRWDRLGLAITAGCTVLAAVLLFNYTVPYAR
jgi:hypothetical protein